MKGVHPGDGELGSFLGAPDLSVQDLFEEERFPNVVVAPDGTVVATWGAKHLVARRSEDGGSGRRSFRVGLWHYIMLFNK